MVEKLIAKGANLNALTRDAKPQDPNLPGPLRAPPGRMTPLLVAARLGKVDVMKALVAAGADTSVKAQDGTTLLLAASGSSFVAAAKFAYQFDKDVTAVDETKSTAMHLIFGGARGGGATQDDMTELAQYLADIGVPLDELDIRGRTPCKAGDGAPFDKPIQRIAEIIYSRGGTPKYIPKEFVKPRSALNTSQQD
jgi:ankyrin repeat protein